MNRFHNTCLCIGVLCLFAVACGGGGGGQTTVEKQSFDLKYCDADKECDADFECSPVFCPADKCIPGADGKCLSCNKGKYGQCLPKPEKTCGDLKCGDGNLCTKTCVGVCDQTTGKCKDVGCEYQCIPGGCTQDADCGSGKTCVSACAVPSCADPTACAKVEKTCIGQCMDAPKPVKCNADKDCGPDQVCEAVMCPMICIADGKGGCLPCNDGFMGTCIPKPTEGCKADADCKPGEVCNQFCMGACDAFAPSCESKCFGQCVKAQGCAGVDCGAGFVCEEICSLCAGAEPPAGATGARKADPSGAQATDVAAPPCGGCFPQCVPVAPPPAQCDTDKDCGAGMHCEPVFCTMECIADHKGGCLPCNDGKMGTCVADPTTGCKDDSQCKEGETCQVYCMGLCDPSGGCSDGCTGVCTPKTQGCQADAECGKGFHCEMMCTKGCGPSAAEPRRGRDMAPKCIDSECFGQCIPDPPPQTACDTDKDCPAGEMCEPVFCDLKCIPDRKGGCEPCNGGKVGMCVPKPVEGCMDDTQCAKDETCQVYCMGACDSSGGCYEACKGVCVPKTQGCASDADCPAGAHCEMMCTKGCADPTEPSGGFAPKCPDSECFGQCVTDPPPMTPCNTDTDCGKGFVCEPIYCADADFCAPDRKGGCLPTPCNDGFLGQCVPAPVQGCFDDTQCAPGEICESYCYGGCGPEGCEQVCEGVCVPKAQDCSDGTPCPAGQECQTVCVDVVCAPGATDCKSGCFGTCVPVAPEPKKCNADTECAAGEHCEMVFCTMVCIQPEDGSTGCLPCNDGFLGVCAADPTEGCKGDAECKAGETCQVNCMGWCSQAGDCGETCFGTCVAKTQGCQADTDCAKGQACEKMCPSSCGAVPPSSGEKPSCIGVECFGQCVDKPVACAADKDCPAGLVCTQGLCTPAAIEGCSKDADCKAGEACVVACPAFCSPEGCSEQCQGQCIPVSVPT
jgi:hypothetical protein